MRYTARTKSIEWKRDPAVGAAVAALARVLATPSPHHHRLTLEPGMGILCNNVLHERTGFVDDAAAPRLLYRARYHDRVAGNVSAARAEAMHDAMALPVPRRAPRRRRARRAAEGDPRGPSRDVGRIDFHGEPRHAVPGFQPRAIRRVRARRAAQGGGVRAARAGARAAEPGGDGAAALRAEPGTGRRPPAPAAISRARRDHAAPHR